MRLTAQAINSAENVLDPDGRLLLILRDLQIPYIENLGVTQDRFGLIDLTGNHIVSLANIPSTFINLQVLLLANNRISLIDNNFPSSNRITSLSLANNSICTFLRNFPKFTRLRFLILSGNPITQAKHYREFMVWLIPTLQILDSNKIKKAERSSAGQLFGPSFDDPSPLALSYFSKVFGQDTIEKSWSSMNHDRNIDHVAQKLSPSERANLLVQLEKATSLQEIEEIENALKSGHVPSEHTHKYDSKQ